MDPVGRVVNLFLNLPQTQRDVLRWIKTVELMTICFKSMPTSFLVTMKLSPSLPAVFPGGPFDSTSPRVYWPCPLVSKLRPSVIRNARMENHNGMLRLPRTCNVIWPAELVTNECHFRQHSLCTPTLLFYSFTRTEWLYRYADARFIIYAENYNKRC